MRETNLVRKIVVIFGSTFELFKKISFTVTVKYLIFV